MVLYIFCSIFFLFLIAACPPFLQRKSEINNGAFEKLIKIKRFKYLFYAPDASVSEEGIALPIFISQVSGYVLFIIMTILNIIFAFISERAFIIMAEITCLVFCIELIILVIFNVILSIISRPRRYFKRNNRDKH